MEKIYNLTIIKNTMPYVLYSLVFLLCATCNQTAKTDTATTVVYTLGKATAIKIPAAVLQDIKTHPLRVTIAEGSDAGLPGHFNQSGSYVLFEPLIPLTPGQTYSVLQGNVFISALKVTGANP